MNILLLGSGGREHALAWKIAKSPNCSKLFIAPGNAGTAKCGENVAIAINNFEALKVFCLTQKIEMVVVGPEEPLVNGIYNFFAEDKMLSSVLIIGPSKAGAQLEGSKSFAKGFMQRYQIPTAAYADFNIHQLKEATVYIANHSLPIVMKADGLAAGKGVVICENKEEALETLNAMLVNKYFGEASSKIVIEQFLKGIEVSVFILTDGMNYKIIGHAKDYKRIGEGDTGANTGGMGCISPVPFVSNSFMEKVKKRIIEPTLSGLQKEHIAYKGFIFFGLINVNEEPYVIEYNCRLGDPETEVILPLLENDIVALFLSLYNGTLSSANIKIQPNYACAIVAVSGGYPGNYQKGFPIYFPEKTTSLIFHSGTLQTEKGIVTNGGRVLTVTSIGKTLEEAVNQSKNTLSSIHFEGMYYRKDIGYEFL